MHKVSAKPRTSAQTNGWTHFRPLSDFEPRVSKTAKQLFFQQHPACRKGLNSTPNIACTEILKPIQFSLVAIIDYRKVRGDLNLSMLSLQLLSPFNQGPKKKVHSTRRTCNHQRICTTLEKLLTSRVD